jgi:hypothetical protein
MVAMIRPRSIMLYLLIAGCGAGRITSGESPAADAGQADDAGGLADGGVAALADPFDMRSVPSYVGPTVVGELALPAGIVRRIHVAADGDDARSLVQVADPATPWRSLARVNQAFAEGDLGPGDALLLRRGDVFRDTLRLSASGSPGAPLVLAGYGDAGAAPPVISGADVVSGWQPYQGEIRAAPLATPVRRVFVDGQPLHLARSPNTGFYRATGATDGVVQAAALAGIDWVGATVWATTEAWLREQRAVVAQSGDALTLASGTTYPILAGTGFIVEGPRAALDAPGEWAQEDGLLYVWLPAGASWETAVLEVASRDAAVTLGSVRDVSDIELRGVELAQTAGFALWNDDFSVSRLHVTDCSFRAVGDSAVRTRVASDLVIEQSRFDGAVSAAVELSGTVGGVFRHNLVLDQNMDPQRGMGFGVGCFPGGCRDVVFEENYIARSGCHGLELRPGCTARRNVIVDAMQKLADGGGIYAYGPDTIAPSFIDNLIIGVLGNGEGVASGDDEAYGIYVDYGVPDATVTGNLVVDARGGYLINIGTTGAVIDDNGAVGGEHGVQLNAKVTSARRNLCVAPAEGYLGLFIAAITDPSPTGLGPVDGNVYRNPFGDNVAAFGGSRYALADWQALSGQDATSRADTTPGIVQRVVVNSELSTRQIDLAPLGGGTWIDVASGRPVTSPLTLEPFAWRVLEQR